MSENNSIDNVIDFTVNEIEDFKRNYIDYYKKCVNQNFKKMLLSIIEQKNEHLKRIKEIKQQGNLNSLFSYKEPIIAKEPTLKYSSAINYLDFLLLIIQRNEIISDLYLKLMNCSLNQDVKLLFKRLEFDIKKQISIISDRYELEKINMG